MVSALFVSLNVMAQDENTERKRPSKEEMVQHRTEEMAKKYALSDDQKAKLLELNTKYADKAAPRGRFNPRHKPMKKLEGKKDFKKREMSDSVMKKREMPKEMKADFEKHKAAMAEYDAELKKILTEEQYKSYSSDREKMMRRHARNHKKD